MQNAIGQIFYFAVAITGIFPVLYGIGLYFHPRVVVEWQTATEIDTLGFNLYRASQLEGPYQKLNSAIIPSSGEALRGGSYRYIDANVVPGQVYYYQLEDIDYQGKATLHPPIVAEVKVQGQAEMILGGILFVFGLVLGGREWIRGVTKSEAYKHEKR